MDENLSLFVVFFFRLIRTKIHLGGICSGSASLGRESWYCDADEKGLGWGCALQIYGSWCHDVELRLLQDFLSCGCTLHPFAGWKMVLGWDGGHLGMLWPAGQCGLAATTATGCVPRDGVGGKSLKAPKPRRNMLPESLRGRFSEQINLTLFQRTSY